MSPPRIMRRTSWLILALPFHVALAGIPVIDGANTSQATISAIQNVVAVTKQIEQYKTQLQQYQNMLQNTAAPAAYTWSEADQTISKLLAAQDTLTYYKTQAGSLEQYLSRYQDTAHYDKAPCIGIDACTAQDHAAMGSGTGRESGYASRVATAGRLAANAASLVADHVGQYISDHARAAIAGTAGGKLATAIDESSKKSQSGDNPVLEGNSLSMSSDEVSDFVNKNPTQD